MTNTALLKELENRIKEGTIKIEKQGVIIGYETAIRVALETKEYSVTIATV